LFYLKLDFFRQRKNGIKFFTQRAVICEQIYAKPLSKANIKTTSGPFVN